MFGFHILSHNLKTQLIMLQKMKIYYWNYAQDKITWLNLYNKSESQQRQNNSSNLETEVMCILFTVVNILLTKLTRIICNILQRKKSR